MGNMYYDQLTKLIIAKPSIQLMQGEVCFYQGDAKSYQEVPKFVQEKGKTKTSFFITPWLSGITRKKEADKIRQETETEYFRGQLYITNMRLVFVCQVNGFNLMIPTITKINRHKDGIRVISGNQSFDVMTKDVQRVLYIIDLMNKAQTVPQQPANMGSQPAPTATRSTGAVSRKDDHAIAAFIHYCEYGGKTIGKTNDEYPSYLTYRFHVNSPKTYHKKVVDAGYLEPAPAALSLQKLKVDQLKQILVANGLSEKGKKGDLVTRIVENVDVSTLKLETIYVPTEQGWTHLRKYGYLFTVEKYGITVVEYEEEVNKGGIGKENDIIWRILNRKFNQYNLSRDFGLARNELLHQAYLLDAEERHVDALMHYILVLYYDMSGCANGGYIEPKADLCLAPAILKAIHDRQKHYSPDMVNRCYERYALPKHHFSKAAFARLLADIFADATIEIKNY